LSPSFDVIVFSETWFSPSLSFGIDGYNSFHSFRPNRRGGGISVYIRNYLQATPVNELTFVNDICECCTVKVSLSADSYVNIVAIYRPPDPAKLLEFNSFVADDILSRFRPSDNVIVVGDLNINLLEPIVPEQQFVDLMHSKMYIPLITKPTHISNNRTSLIDHMWTNFLGPVWSGVFDWSITDHLPVFAIVSIRPSKNIFKKVFRDHSQASMALLRENMDLFARSNEDFNPSDTDFNATVELIQSELYKIYDRCCPLRVKTISNKSITKPWISGEIKNMISHKHELFQLFRMGIVQRAVYNQCRNELTLMLRRAKTNYFSAKFAACQNNIRLTWKNLNSIIRPDSQHLLLTEIVHDGRVINKPSEIASIFNNYFSTVASELDSNIPPSIISPLTFMNPPNQASFFAFPSTADEVTGIITSFPSKGCHPQSIPIHIFKILSDILSPIFSKLFNVSLLCGIFPDCLKIARVIPIHKSGNKLSVSNYRPISTLSNLSKVFEKLMSRRMNVFLKSCNILSKHQFGFRAGTSTSDAILEFLDHAYNSINQQQSIISVFLDFSKAFDTVNHEILLRKLSHYGFRGISNKWFHSYLSNRYQYVSLPNNAISCNTRVQLGVPQGSILGPLLFLLYINDMSNCDNNLQFVHFADDTTVFCSRDSAAGAIDVMNGGLLGVDQWLKSNRLSLNVNKTFYMCFSRNNIPPGHSIVIRDVNLKRIPNIKFLGIVLDERLDFKEHTNVLCQKLARAVGVMYRVSHLLPAQVLLKLYYSLFYSHMVYGITSYGKSSIGNVNRVKSLQNRAVALLPSNNDSPYRFNKLFNFDETYQFFSLLKFFRCIKSNNDEHFFTKIRDLLPIHNYQTRFSVNEKFYLPALFKSRCKSSFIYHAVHFWNSLPLNVRNSLNFLQFKRNLRNHLLQL
jgi:hypothetical protein